MPDGWDPPAAKTFDGLGLAARASARTGVGSTGSTTSSSSSPASSSGSAPTASASYALTAIHPPYVPPEPVNNALRRQAFSSGPEVHFAH
ncbi:hypothetical protein DACRYDRAFT_25288 [Dacryopinax primogenitus]|uniref:Uncharacterized protein n=1 Tax=Dacryopinax primogenitus (strain DJM 731) TaxID=1858805 RepID=M5FQV9_DACPD|nr:uncharacterized protein DACRYDRAFT_25288 [Dacryopinax primogenitus]EJT97174.1 hypothetical protein DACRYDRAFT_25288 [Dacryopinax primogenitus]